MPLGQAAESSWALTVSPVRVRSARRPRPPHRLPAPGDLLHEAVRSVADALRAPYAAVILPATPHPQPTLAGHPAPKLWGLSRCAV